MSDKISTSKYHPKDVYWGIVIDGIRVGISLDGIEMHKRLRVAQLNASKKWIIDWIIEAQRRLNAVGFPKIECDVIFGYLENNHLGLAVIDKQKHAFFLVNTFYLSGKMRFKSIDAVNTFVHEWSHIWLFRKYSAGDKAAGRYLRSEVVRFREKYADTKDPAIIYALKDKRGDELLAYGVEYYDKVSQDFRDVVDTALKK